MSKKLTVDEINKKISDRNIFIKEYDGCQKPVKVYCKICGHTWTTKALVITNLHCGCPKCQKEKAANKLRFSGDNFLKKYNLDSLYTIDGYKNVSTKANFICKKCGYVRTTDPNTVRRHPDCPNCTGIKHNLTNDDFLKRVKVAHGDEYTVLSEYQNLTTKVKIKHNICGKTFETRPGNFVGTKNKLPCGCPFCYSRSKGEKIIANYLEKKNINYKSEYRFADCKDVKSLPFDFVIFKDSNEIDYIIEYDGPQHKKADKSSSIYTTEKLEITKKHDAIKDKYCKDNNIVLYRISYRSTEKIYKKLDKILLERSTTIENTSNDGNE